MTHEEADQFLAVFLHGANNLMETLDKTKAQIDDLNRVSDQLDNLDKTIGEI